MRHREAPNRFGDALRLPPHLLPFEGACGHAMSPRPGMGQSGEYYPYYQCGASEKSVGGACPRRCVPAETLDRAVLEFMKQLHLNPERIRVIAAGATSSRARR